MKSTPPSIKDISSTMQGNLGSKIQEYKYELESFKGLIANSGRGNKIRQVFHKLISPYFSNQNKINALIEEILDLTLHNLESIIQAQHDDKKELLTENKRLKRQITAIENIQLRSQTSEASAIKEKLAFLMDKVLKSDQSFVGVGNQFQKAYYSQFGEDEWIVNNIPDLPSKGYFLEIGASDGITFSNTYYFEKLGWEGICFEPNPYQYTQAKLYRQQVEPVAITKQDGDVELHLSKSFPDWSSIVPSDDTQEIIIVPGKSLETIIAENKINNIDLLSVDVEGAELDVLEGFPFEKHQPYIVIVEFMNKLNEKNDEVKKFMKKQPYKLVHTTFANYIYQRK